MKKILFFLIVFSGYIYSATKYMYLNNNTNNKIKAVVYGRVTYGTLGTEYGFVEKEYYVDKNKAKTINLDKEGNFIPLKLTFSYEDGRVAPQIITDKKDRTRSYIFSPGATKNSMFTVTEDLGQPEQ